MNAALVFLALSLAAGDDVLARAGEIRITRADAEERAVELGARGMPSSLEQAVDSLVLDAVLSAEARRTGLADDAAVRERLERERRREASAAFLQRELAAMGDPSDSELRKMFHSTSDSVRLKLLVFASEDAARVGLALAQRGRNFDDAMRAAVPGFSPAGSDAPKIRGQMSAALATAAFEAPEGGVGGPVQLESGWAIFKVLERTIGDDREFTARRASLVKFAREQRADAVREHLGRQLRAKAKVTVDEGFLASLGKRQELTRAELEHAVATVNGAPVRYRDIEASARQLATESGHAPGVEIRKQLLAAEIERRLLEDAAVEQGLTRDPRVIARAPIVERRALATAFVDKLRSTVPPPTEKEVRAFFRANVARTGQELDSVRAAITAHLLENRQAEAFGKAATQLRARANVTVETRAIQASKEN